MELAELRSQFKQAYDAICDELKLKPKRVRYEYETPNIGVTYFADANSKDYSIEFQLDTYTTGANIAEGRTKVRLQIEYSPNALPYFVGDDITSLRKRKDFLIVWVRDALRRFRSWYQNEPLDVLFHGMVLRAYGQPGYTNPTMTEFRLLIGGLITSQKPRKTLVYRFHHTDEDTGSKFFSYAILASTLIQKMSLATHQCWIFFPEAAGESGGTNYQDLLTIEEELLGLLKKRIKKTEIKDIEVEYDVLEDYLLENAEGFGMRTVDVEYLQTIKAGRENHVFVLCEGPTDRKYINKFAERLGMKDSLERVSPLFMFLKGKKDIELGILDAINTEPVPFVLIQDRDEKRNDDYVRKLLAKFGQERVHVWKRREIENYTLDYEAILAILKERGLKKPEIKDKIKRLTISDVISVVRSLAERLRTKVVIMQFLQELPNNILSYEEKRIFVERNSSKNEAEIDDIISDFSRNLVDRIAALNSSNLREKLNQIQKELSVNWNESGILKICPGKDLLVLINKWSLKEFGISISGYDLIKKLKYVDPDVTELVNKIIKARTDVRRMY